MLSQRAANIIAFAKAASTMFAMDAMLSHRPGHLKMPRPDAYLVAAIDDIVAAMGKNQLDAAVQNEVVAILYSLKGDVVRR